MSKTKYIEDPVLLWQYFTDYKKWVFDNPFRVEDFVGKDGRVVERKKQRPMSIMGFESYLADLDIISDLKDYLSNKGKKYDEFEPVSRRIKANILSEQVEGAMANVFNHNIVARVNGLVDKAQVESLNRHFEITMDLGNKLEDDGESQPLTINFDGPEKWNK